MVYALFSHSYHVTSSCDVTYYTTVTLWPVTLDHVILSHTLSLYSKSRKEKKKKKKRNINNDLAILPSYDTIPLLSFLIPKILQLVV